MFDRLKQALRGGSTDAGESQHAVITELGAGDDPVEFTDKEGNQVLLSRETYGESLSAKLREAGSDPDAVYEVATAAIADELDAESLEAATKLAELEPDSERSAAALALAQQRNGQLEAAQHTLEGYIARHGPTGVILTNLAKVQGDRGDAAAERSTLRDAVRLDPNQENGFDWWLAKIREEEGEAAAERELRDLAALPGSWRAQLHLASSCLERGELDEALRLYDDMLARAPESGEALAYMVSELAGAGHADAAIARAAPRYRPERHGYPAGHNLLQAYVDTGDWQRGESLLAQLRRLDDAPRDLLDGFEARLTELKRQEKG
jgi:pentatricopeptide repeat protein